MACRLKKEPYCAASSSCRRRIRDPKLRRRKQRLSKPVHLPDNISAGSGFPMRVGLVSKPLARISHTRKRFLINTGALARWKGAVGPDKLFQHFVTVLRKPLKRLISRRALGHRAKA